MKRKFKLITTIASLTAAIALLMFGVYAYTGARTATISGTVGFVAQYVDAKVTVMDGAHLTTPVLAVKGTKTFQSGASANQEAFSQTLSSPTLNDTTLVYQYTVEVENLGASPIYMVLTIDSDKATTGHAEKVAGIERVVSVKNNDVEVNPTYVNDDVLTIAATQKVLLTVTYTVTPSLVTGSTIASFNIGSTLGLATTSDAAAALLP